MYFLFITYFSFNILMEPDRKKNISLCFSVIHIKHDPFLNRSKKLKTLNRIAISRWFIKL